ARSDCVPVRIERACGDGDPGSQSQLRCPYRCEAPRDLIRRRIASPELFTNTAQQWVDGPKELFGGESAELRVPHPFVAHGANAERRLPRIGDTAQSSGKHVAVFKGRNKARSFFRMMPKPVQKFRKTPLG